MVVQTHESLRTPARDRSGEAVDAPGEVADALGDPDQCVLQRSK